MTEQARATANERHGFRFTPTWLITIVFCGLAIYVVVQQTGRVSEVSVAGAGVKFGGGDPEELKELAENVKNGGTAPTVTAPETTTDQQQATIEKIVETTPPAPQAIDLQHIIGGWRDHEGTAYEIVALGNNALAITETSAMYGVPIQTMAGRGTLVGNRFEFAFNTWLGASGVGVLQPGEGQTLTGKASFPVTGDEVLVALRR